MKDQRPHEEEISSRDQNPRDGSENKIPNH